MNKNKFLKLVDDATKEFKEEKNERVIDVFIIMGLIVIIVWWKYWRCENV